MLCIYSGKDRLLLQNKTIIMFLSLVSGSFGSMNKSQMSTFHTAHLFGSILSCNTILQTVLFFLRRVFFFPPGLSTRAQQWQCILTPCFLEYNQLLQTTMTYSEISKVLQFIQVKKSHYTSVAPSMNTNIQCIKVGDIHRDSCSKINAGI